MNIFNKQKNKELWLKKYSKSSSNSLEYAIAEDKLMEAGLLPDRSRIIESKADFDKYLSDLENME